MKPASLGAFADAVFPGTDQMVSVFTAKMVEKINNWFSGHLMKTLAEISFTESYGGADIIHRNSFQKMLVDIGNGLADPRCFLGGSDLSAVIAARRPAKTGKKSKQFSLHNGFIVGRLAVKFLQNRV